MENEVEPETKTNNVEAEQSKPSLIDKLKRIRWTFKVKNNLSEYVTVEPLICFYMAQLFVATLTEPYHFHKACVSLERDAHFCDIITINPNSNYQLCADYDSKSIYCKGFTESIGFINCSAIAHTYENNKTKAFANPEDYRFCKIVQETWKKAYKEDEEFSVDHISDQPESVPSKDNLHFIYFLTVTILIFLVAMILSIWSDKYNKRKLCLLLPILGQLIINIMSLHGALSNFLSFEFINSASKFITSLSGGMPLFLFACFSYMNNDTFRHKLLFRFGVISLLLTIYRYIPILYDTVYEYFHDDDSYIGLISLNLVFNILCLLYVKIILNESKQEVAVNAVDNESESVKSYVQSVDSDGVKKARKYTKRKQVAKVFSLDVVWDYILIIFKRRNQYERFFIILFLAIVLVDNVTSLGFDDGFVFKINESYSINTVDIDGGIFVIISILILLFNVSAVVVAILVIGIRIAARLLIFSVVAISYHYEYYRLVADVGTDVYSPFKRIASSSFLLAYVSANESRIFLIVQAIAYLPRIMSWITISDTNFTNIIVFLVQLLVKKWIVTATYLVLIALVFCGLCLLYIFDKKYKKRKAEQMLPNTVQNIAEVPWTVINPSNFQIQKETDQEQAPVSKKYSTHL